MPISPGLEVWLYNPHLATPAQVAYGRRVEQLSFSSAAPGGCRDFSATIHLANARLPYPELGLFSRIAVMGETPTGVRCVWQGEITDPELALSEQDGESLTLTGLGYQNCMLDDTISTSYVNQKVQQIAKNQLTGSHGGLTRTNFLPLDADTSALFPDNPSTTYSPAYPGYHMQDVFSNLCVLAGDYTWGVWPHPLGTQPSSPHTDAAGFPTAQLQAHLRDTTTLSYMASEEAGDVVEWHIVPSSQRAYNVIVIAYNDPSQSPPVGLATYTDSRLAGNGSQGTAPFRRRMLYRDLSGVSTVTKSQAQAIANAYGALYKDPTNKIAVTLRSVRDGNGMRVPLWMPWADTNIFIPTLSIRGATLPTTRMAGVNTFYVVEAVYAETENDATLTLQLDNWVDTVESVVARLQTQSDFQNRAGQRTTGVVQASGSPIVGWGSFEYSNTLNGDHVGVGVDYPTVAVNTPTSAALTTTSVLGVNTLGSSNFTQYGHHISGFSTGGNVYWKGTYQTSGNCLLEVDEPGDPRGRFAHHCDGCNTVRRGLKLAQDLVAVRRSETDHGHNKLTYACPICGTLPGGLPRVVESFNTGLGPEDEDPDAPGNSEWRAEQARLIRKAMAHPHVNLPRREHPLKLTTTPAP